MKAAVNPYDPDMLVTTDAIRGPLASVFKLHLEDVMNYRDEKR